MCSFLWLSNIPLCICTTASFSIHLSGHLGCFYVLTIVNSAAMNNGIHVLFNFGFLWVYAQEGDHWIIWWFYSQFLKESPYHLPQWQYQFTFPPTVQERSLFSTPSPAFILCRHFDDGHSAQCEVTSHFSFDLHFSNNERCCASFHVFVSHLHVFFEEMSVYICFPLFDWVVCFSGIQLYELLVYFGN